jgi:hypothetical protein
VDLTAEFTVTPTEGGSLLQVTQNGFPSDPIADNFYASCDKGWRDTFQSINRFFADRDARITSGA